MTNEVLLPFWNTNLFIFVTVFRFITIQIISTRILTTSIRKTNVTISTLRVQGTFQLARTIYCTYLIWRTIQIWLTSLQAHSKTTAIIKDEICLIKSLMMNVNLPITKLIFIAVILIKAFLQAFTVLMAYVSNWTVIINSTKVMTNSMIFMTILTRLTITFLTT